MQLQRMAEMTGGQAFFPSSVKELDKIYDKIRAEIAARYSLGYVSTDTRMDGAWRKVRDPAEAARPEGRQAAHPRGLLRALQGPQPADWRQSPTPPSR